MVPSGWITVQGTKGMVPSGWITVQGTKGMVPSGWITVQSTNTIPSSLNGYANTGHCKFE